MTDQKGRMFSPLTIVGGRPPSRPTISDDVPRGIEVLIQKAAVDDEFRELLLTDYQAAAESIDLDLSDGEHAVLGSVPPATLSAMIARVEVPLEHRSVFKGRVAAAMLAIVAGTTFACSPPGIAPGGCVVQPEEQTQEQSAEPKDGKKKGEGETEEEDQDTEEPR
jgi:hypothetical protein